MLLLTAQGATLGLRRPFPPRGKEGGMAANGQQLIANSHFGEPAVHSLGFKATNLPVLNVYG